MELIPKTWPKVTNNKYWKRGKDNVYNSRRIFKKTIWTQRLGPKYLLTLDNDPDTDFNGIQKLNVLEWLI